MNKPTPIKKISLNTFLEDHTFTLSQLSLMTGDSNSMKVDVNYLVSGELEIVPHGSFSHFGNASGYLSLYIKNDNSKSNIGDFYIECDYDDLKNFYAKECSDYTKLCATMDKVVNYIKLNDEVKDKSQENLNKNKPKIKI